MLFGCGSVKNVPHTPYLRENTEDTLSLQLYAHPSTGEEIQSLTDLPSLDMVHFFSSLYYDWTETVQGNSLASGQLKKGFSVLC